jgi:hypothetical protein
MVNLPELPKDKPAATGEVEVTACKLGARHGMAARLIAIGRDCASRLTESERAMDYNSILFDKMGLPK